MVLITDHIMVLHAFGLPWAAAATDAGISYSLLFLASLLVMNTLRFYLPRGEQYVNIFSLVLILSIAWLLLVKWLLSISIPHFFPGLCQPAAAFHAHPFRDRVFIAGMYHNDQHCMV